MKSACVGILILILVICGAVKSRSTENLVASATAAAEPKLPDRATKVKGGDEANRRLMALSEEDRRSVFLRILALAKEHCVEITRIARSPGSLKKRAQSACDDLIDKGAIITGE